jgi:hypothetical protein
MSERVRSFINVLADFTIVHSLCRADDRNKRICLACKIIGMFLSFIINNPCSLVLNFCRFIHCWLRMGTRIKPIFARSLIRDDIQAPYLLTCVILPSI